MNTTTEQARKCLEQVCKKFDYWPPDEGPFLTVIQRHMDSANAALLQENKDMEKDKKAADHCAEHWRSKCETLEQENKELRHTLEEWITKMAEASGLEEIEFINAPNGGWFGSDLEGNSVDITPDGIAKRIKSREQELREALQWSLSRLGSKLKYGDRDEQLFEKAKALSRTKE